MFRVANVVMVLALLITAAAVYQLKYASTAEAERLATLRQAIRKERDAIALMRAEWARRTSPLYIQGLVQRHLDLKPLEVEAISDLSDLPEKPAGNSDGIGGMIEALVDTPLVTSSTSRSATPPAPSPAGSTAPVSTTAPASSALRAGPPPARPAAPRPSAQAAPAPPPASYVPPPAPAASRAETPSDGLGSLLPPGALPDAMR